MLIKLGTENHKQPFKDPISITRVQPGEIFQEDGRDFAFGPLSIIDHAVMKKGIKIKMHEHVNDEILSYVRHGVTYHKDSAGFEAPIAPGKLMLMNAGSSFWHEEKVKDGYVEMLQIFIRPRETNLKPGIQFHDKPIDHSEWYVMVGPENSEAPLHVRQSVYILDAHAKAGETLKIPVYEGLTPFLYVMSGEITIGDLKIGRQEAVTDLENPFPPVTAITDTTLVLFQVDMNAEMSMEGTISGV
ncbi:pirin family protein [Oceanobacillus chungangensis]|uniref:Pirin N-terminal domain-containing protein n=1 Tax=Oceanobacillus chungangensis TaxID=1229152 RepID=A0A3D8PRZ6_9BACI|nr:pirin family protein [Oceanobacillus chungangensis]RDW18910.1 hypothetical protein CWR45_08830 [Oceanobacillus chungangensis]